MPRSLALPSLHMTQHPVPLKLSSKVSARLPKLPDPNTPDVFAEMTLIEHLEELRDRTLRPQYSGRRPRDRYSGPGISLRGRLLSS